ncbi:MAG: Fis family transcriptional regulator [Nitrospirota bacterium]|nr:Fis family transcriptional regulator [Nitrospirota bacterium]
MPKLKDMTKKTRVTSRGKRTKSKNLLIQEARSCSIKEFLEEKLNRYLKEMSRLENSNLYKAVLSEVEKSLILIILKETEGNQLKAAKTLGINRNTLRAKIQEYKIRL